VESLSSLRRCEKNAEAEFMALSIPRCFASQSEAAGESREGGLKKQAVTKVVPAYNEALRGLQPGVSSRSLAESSEALAKEDKKPGRALSLAA
jgi:hypothetical protein